MTKTTKFLLAGTAALILWPRKAESQYTVDGDGRRRLDRLNLRTGIGSLEVRSQPDGQKNIRLSLIEVSNLGQKTEKIQSAARSLRQKAADRRQIRRTKRQERQRQPIFQSALEWVSGKNVADAPSLARKLKVGVGFGEALLESMEEMGVVSRRPDGKYRVLMPKKMIDALLGE